MKNFIFLFLFVFFSFYAQAIVPHRVIVPDIPGYKTLKADFHVHTVFSDGSVWPTTRVDEAVMDGLDVLAITDHVEQRLLKQSNAGLFHTDRNESYKIASKAGKGADLLVISGGEITRAMTPGHFNTLFDTDCEAIAAAGAACGDDEMKVAEASLREAKRQGAFCFWNHPHWERQAPNGPVWYPEHTQLYKEGLMQGIEIFNSVSGFSDEAYGWALDKNLTLVSGTDCHRPLFVDLDYQNGQLRPVTLVFAQERTLKSVHEALLAHRTAVFANDLVYGREDMMKPLFEAVFQVTKVSMTSKKLYITVNNQSSIPLHLTKGKGNESISYQRNFVIRPFQEYTIMITQFPSDIRKKGLDLHFVVSNFFVGVGDGLKYTYHVDPAKL